MSHWIKITHINEIPKMGSRTVLVNDLEIALFKTKDDSIFAVNNICPHKQGKLSEGLVHEHAVTCPLHNANIALTTGEALNEDYGCTDVYATKIEDEVVYLQLG